MKVCLVVSCLALLAGCAHGYATGADKESCGNLKPGHGSEQSGSNGHTITTSSNSFTPGSTITVTISGGTINGMMMQAQPASKDFAVGTWSDHSTAAASSGFKYMQCNAAADTVTHTSSSGKSASRSDGIKFTWTAPTSCKPGTVNFKLTSAPGESTYYMGMMSSDITASGYDSVTTECSGAAAIKGGLFTLFLAVLAYAWM